MAKTVTLDDGTLARLAADRAAVQAFAFLRRPPHRPCCAQKSADAQAAWARTARSAVLALPADRLAQFKALMGADVLSVPPASGGQSATV